jgi:hypothetical protein
MPLFRNLEYFEAVYVDGAAVPVQIESLPKGR